MRIIRATVLAAAVLVTIAATSYAENWGAGIPPNEDDRCTENDPASQCTANSSVHTVFIPLGINGYMRTALETSIDNDYNVIDGIVAFESSSFDSDVRVYETNLGMVPRARTQRA